MFHPIFEEEQQNITRQIDTYLKTTFRDKIKGSRAHVSSSILPRHFIVMANRSRFYNLYIRFNSNYKNDNIRYKTIVVAQISFEKTHRKSGSKLLYELIKITKQYRYEYMMIECVNEDSQAFAERLGFKAYKPYPDNIWPADTYFVSINKLEHLLKKYLQRDICP